MENQKMITMKPHVHSHCKKGSTKINWKHLSGAVMTLNVPVYNIFNASVVVWVSLRSVFCDLGSC